MITTLICLGLGLAPLAPLDPGMPSGDPGTPAGPQSGALSLAAGPALLAQTDGYSELYREYKQARREYRVALRVARQEGREKEFDQPQPINLFFDRFEALAKAGSAEALYFCALEVQELKRPVEEIRAFKSAAFKRLSTEHVAHPLMEKLVTKIGREGAWISEKEITGVLGRVAKEGHNDDTKAEASYQLARRLEAQGTAFGVKRANEIYAFVRDKFPDSRAARRSMARLEALKLAPGNEAPDFSAVDPDGNAFKLSDYRGKVVVLDFWGFW